MKKRVLAMVMALCLALSLLPVTAGAVEDETTELASISDLVAAKDGTYDNLEDENYTTNAAHVSYTYYTDKTCAHSARDDDGQYLEGDLYWVKTVTITGINFGELNDGSEDMKKLQDVIRNGRRTDTSEQFKDSIEVNFVNCTFNQETTHFQVYKIRPCDVTKYSFNHCTFNQQNSGQYAITLNTSETAYNRPISYEINGCTINSQGRGINITAGTEQEALGAGMSSLPSVVVSGNTFHLPDTSESNMAIQIAGVWDNASLTDNLSPLITVSDNEIDAYVAVRVHDSMGNNTNDSAKYLVDFTENILLNGTLGVVADVGDDTADNVKEILQAIVESYENSGETSFIIPATSVSLSQDSVTLYSDTTSNTVTLTATVTPANSTDAVTWESSNVNVATVAGGVVTAVANGTAIITAKAGNYSATCVVNVTSYSPTTPSGGNDNTEPSYSPVMDVSDGGTVRVSPRTPSEGDEVTLTVEPDSGYEVADITVTDRSGREVDVTAGRDGTYTFTQPTGRVTIEVTFAPVGGETVFTDVPETFWAYDEIMWAQENGYVNGVTATTFSPNATISRQQIWMILARISGYNPADMAAARAWSISSGISDGTNPGGAVTRQQLAALLYRFAESQDYDVTQRADLSAYPDAGSVSDYAVEPLQWAVAEGIVSGTTAGTLNPQGTATRTQFAVMLYRFLAV